MCDTWQFEMMHPMRLALVAAALPLFWFWHKSLVRSARWRQVASLAARLLAVVALVVAMSEVRILHNSPREVTSSVLATVTPPKPVPSKSNAVFVASRPDLIRSLVQTLSAKGFRTECVAPEVFSDNPGGLVNCDLLVLSNVPAVLLSKQATETVQFYVQRGGGLIVLGGDRALTPGGYHDAAIEEMLPLVCVPKPDRPKPTMALVLVLDCSGSMNGEKIRLAKLATKQTVETLGARDMVGVLAFDERNRWIHRLGRCDDKEAVLRRVDATEAGGGTRMHPALEQAFSALQAVSADARHILLLTDGVSQPGDFDSLCERIAKARISASIVGLGGNTDQNLLKQIAEKSNGRCYFAANAEVLPRIFVSETLVAAKTGIAATPCRVRAATTSAEFDGIDFRAVPSLSSHVETRLKPKGQVLVEADNGDPLLATWRYGQGRVAAFTSDLEGRWSASWLTWSGFARFWAQLGESIARVPASPPTTLGEHRDAVLTPSAEEPSLRVYNLDAILLAAALVIYVADILLVRRKLRCFRPT